MGCAFSCFRVEDVGDNDEHSQPPAAGVNICHRCITLSRELCDMLFQRSVDVSSSLQGATSQPGSAVQDSSIPNSYRNPPLPLPYDDPRCSSSPRHREGLALRGEKPSSHFREEPDIGQRITGTTHKLHGSDCKGLSKSPLSQSSLKVPFEEASSGVLYLFESPEDECPTCLEEYTTENPRITMQCSHHYHLSCIYEWMERSEACPVCGKVMVFKETSDDVLRAQ